MLRITRTSDASHVLLKLEGKLLAAWVGEVREQIPSHGGMLRDIRLDLSQVSFIDTAGELLLRDLILRGVIVTDCSNYLSELLHLEKQ